MAHEKYNADKIESIIRRVIGYYLDSAEDDNMDLLHLYLSGGKIPTATAKILEPILRSLADEGAESRSVLDRSDFDALEQLRREVEKLYEEKTATRSELKSAINTLQWSELEQALADRFGLKLLPTDDRSLNLLAQEVAISDFTTKEIISTFHNSTDMITEFCGHWYADCSGCDYREGNQGRKVLGISQGFMVSYIIFYLYAANAPDGLIGFFKRRKMAHGKKIAKDVLRVYQKLKTV